MVWGLWFGVQGRRSSVSGVGFRVQGSGFRVWGVGLRVTHARGHGDVFLLHGRRFRSLLGGTCPLAL